MKPNNGRGKLSQGTFMLLQVIFSPEMIGSEETNELGKIGGNF